MNTEDLARLKQTLDELHTELERLDPADDEVRGLLAEALAEIQSRLQDKESGLAAESASASLPSRLASTAREFEETHPHLAGLVGSVIDALSRMGI